MEKDILEMRKKLANSEIMHPKILRHFLKMCLPVKTRTIRKMKKKLAN